MSSQVPFLPCLPSSSQVLQLLVWRTTSSLVPYLRVLLSPTLVLIPSRLVTLASVAIPSLLAQEATARSSSDQQLRAQPGSRAFAAQHHHQHHITKLPKSPPSSFRLSKFQTSKIKIKLYIYLHIVFCSIKILMVLIFFNFLILKF